MNHWTARRLLPTLLDHTLPPRLEAEVRGHARHCRRCLRVLDEFEASAALLARLPATLVPLEPSAASHERLASLARWAPVPRPEWREQLGLSALGAAAAAVMLVMAISLSGWGPVMETRSDPVMLAGVLPDSCYLPTGWR